MKLSGFELNTIQHVLNGVMAPATIKELRFLEGAVTKISSAKPSFSERPIRENYENDISFDSALEEWDKEVMSINDAEIECPLTEMETLLIKSRLNSYNKFMSSSDARSRILKMADKFGL